MAKRSYWTRMTAHVRCPHTAFTGHPRLSLLPVACGGLVGVKEYISKSEAYYDPAIAKKLQYAKQKKEEDE